MTRRSPTSCSRLHGTAPVAFNPRKIVPGQAVPLTGGAATGRMPGPPANVTRFRSFVERFVIERCGKWSSDQISRDAWNEVQNAKTTYRMIIQADREFSEN